MTDHNITPPKNCAYCGTLFYRKVSVLGNAQSLNRFAKQLCCGNDCRGKLSSKQSAERKLNEPMTADMLRGLVNYDPESGLFIRVGRPRPGSVLGFKDPKGYVRFRVGGVKLGAHRAAWLYVYGQWPVNQIDHIDGDRANNAISNLRDVPATLNAQNRQKAHANNKSGFLGVHPVSGASTWQAGLWINGRRVHLGCFVSPELAHAAYLAAKCLHHEGCTI